MIASGGCPGRPSVASKIRPRFGCALSSAKVDGVTRATGMRTASPRPVRVMRFSANMPIPSMV